MIRLGRRLIRSSDERLIIAGVRQYLSENPARHDQGVWLEWTGFSTTSIVEVGALLTDPYVRGCVASWAVLLCAPEGTQIWHQGSPNVPAHVHFPDGSRETVATYAKRLLNVEGSEHIWLFGGNRTSQEVDAALAALIGATKRMTITDFTKLAGQVKQ